MLLVHGSVVHSVLRVVGAGVCHVWYSHSENHTEELEFEDLQGEEMGVMKCDLPEPEYREIPRYPTLGYLKQALTISFESVVQASLFAKDLRGARAALGSFQYDPLIAVTSTKLNPNPDAILYYLRNNCKGPMCGLGILINWELRIINKLMRYSNFFAHSQVCWSPTSLLEFHFTFLTLCSQDCNLWQILL